MRFKSPYLPKRPLWVISSSCRNRIYVLIPPHPGAVKSLFCRSLHADDILVIITRTDVDENGALHSGSTRDARSILDGHVALGFGV